MNAPTDTRHLDIQLEFELIPHAAIALSETAMQMKRRADYDAGELAALARSIAEQGLMHPIVIRPLDALRGLAKYELVAGERRYLATQQLGHEHVLARIVTLTDQQVLKLQMVENLHRDPLRTLAEAEGYRELIAGGMKAEEIGDSIGKSRSYVYARVKLLQLAPAVQEALAKNEIDASQALLFARVPTAKLQEQALNTLRKWHYQGHGEKLSFRRTAEILGDKAKGILIPLAAVPWQLDDETFWAFGPKDRRGTEEAIALPSCLACPKRSGNDPELLAAIEDPNVCTDKECHDAKGKQTFERRRKAVEASGQQVLAGEEAAAIMPTDYGSRGYVDLDAECDDDEYPEKEPDTDDPGFDAWNTRYMAWKPRTYRQLLGADVEGLEIVLVQDPKQKSRIRELAPDKEVQKRLKAKGLKLKIARDNSQPEKPAKPVDPEKAARQAEKEARDQAAAELAQEVDRGTRIRLLKAVFEKWKGPLHRDELELITDELLEQSGWSELVNILYPKGMNHGKLATLGDRELGRFLLMFVVCGRLDDYGGDGDDRPLKAIAKRLKIDPKALEKQVRAELAGQNKAPAEKAGKKAKK